MTVANPIARKATRIAKCTRQTNGAGRELMAGLKQVYEAVMSGDRFRGMQVREVEIPDPPNYTSTDIKSIRGKFGVSATLFARLMGVSRKLMENWEHGRRTPNPLACRLLERIDADPAAHLASVVKRRILTPSRQTR